ncbi:MULTISPECIES: hypothetical protein [unclassified Streptomyces]|uniref:hypothetical protein n=1 Tax=unclassified Streptomyces TaxID=2593676 RepID=UPI0037F9C533
MGAMVAYEPAPRLERTTGQGPVHLFVGAAHAPGTGAVPTDAPAERPADHIRALLRRSARRSAQ